MSLRFVKRMHLIARHVKTGKIICDKSRKIYFFKTTRGANATMRNGHRAIMRNGLVCEEQINTLIIRFFVVLFKLKCYIS